MYNLLHLIFILLRVSIWMWLDSTGIMVGTAIQVEQTPYVIMWSWKQHRGIISTTNLSWWWNMEQTPWPDFTWYANM